MAVPPQIKPTKRSRRPGVVVGGGDAGRGGTTCTADGIVSEEEALAPEGAGCDDAPKDKGIFAIVSDGIGSEV